MKTRIVERRDGHLEISNEPFFPMLRLCRHDIYANQVNKNFFIPAEFCGKEDNPGKSTMRFYLLVYAKDVIISGTHNRLKRGDWLINGQPYQCLSVERCGKHYAVMEMKKIKDKQQVVESEATL